MYPVSQKFLDAVRAGYTDYCEAEFFYLGASKGTVPIIAGDVSIDKTAQIRRSTNLSFSGASPELALPGVADYFASPLWPIGNEVQVRAGILFDDGTKELVPMGLFRVSKPSLTHTDNELSVSLQGFDRSRQVSRSRFTKNYSITKGLDYATAIKLLLQSRMPSLDDGFFRINWMLTDGSDGNPAYKTPDLSFTSDDDPWDEAQQMARSFGAELLFDGLGNPVLRPENDPLYTPSSFDYVLGEQCTFESMTRDMDDETTYNGVIAIGQTPNAMKDFTGVTPRAEAWDINPNSPTYYDPDRPTASSYGAVPFFYTSTYMTSVAQCQAAANSMLNKVMGVLEAISFNSINNYAHDAGDVIKAQDLAIGVDAVHIFDALRFTLGPEGAMNGTTRKRRAG